MALTCALGRTPQGDACLPQASLRSRRGHFHHLALLVVATVRAGVVRKFHLVAVRTLRESRRDQMIVRAPFGLSSLGMTPFRIRHENS